VEKLAGQLLEPAVPSAGAAIGSSSPERVQARSDPPQQRQCQPRGSDAVDEHVLVTRGPLGRGNVSNTRSAHALAPDRADGRQGGLGRLELTKFHTPTAVSAEPENAPANTLGIRRIMFAVEDIEDVLARLHTHGAELVGELEQYEDSYRLCYVRGPEGIIVALAEQLS
jgi:catechol 2,3-dioxygenase-like lactoylglutathione lyase family enzyme